MKAMKATYRAPRIKWLTMDAEAPIAMSTQEEYSPNPSYAKESPVEADAPTGSVWDE